MTMKRIILRFFIAIPILASFSKCTTNSSPIDNESLSPCTDRKYVLEKKFDNIVGTIIESRSKDSTGTTLFYIDATSTTNTIPFYPCNLPQKARVKGLKIKFSGHLVTYPGFETVQVEALPFQLSKIEYN